MAMGAAAQELVWVSRIETVSKGMKKHFPTPITVDSRGAIKVAKNDASGNQTKHIDMKYHLLRDMFWHGLYLRSHTVPLPKWSTEFSHSH